MGHAQCGGVRALVYGAPPQARDFVASWVEIGKPALADGGERRASREVEAARRAAVDAESDDIPVDRRGGRGGALVGAGVHVRYSHRRTGAGDAGGGRAGRIEPRRRNRAHERESQSSKPDPPDGARAAGRRPHRHGRASSGRTRCRQAPLAFRAGARRHGGAVPLRRRGDGRPLPARGGGPARAACARASRARARAATTRPRSLEIAADGDEPIEAGRPDPHQEPVAASDSCVDRRRAGEDRWRWARRTRGQSRVRRHRAVRAASSRAAASRRSTAARCCG